MASVRANVRVQIGSAAWITGERDSALQIASAESEEFAFSARNEVDWLNEHMAEVFSENQLNVADIFKTPGKLRGKTPRTARKVNPVEARVPLSDVFSATPRAKPSPFRHIDFQRPLPAFRVAEDEPAKLDKPAIISLPAVEEPLHDKINTSAVVHGDSGYYGSQAVDATQPTQPNEPFSELHGETQQQSVQDEPRPNIEPLEEAFNDVQLTGERPSTEGSFQSAEDHPMGIVETVVSEQAEEDQPVQQYTSMEDVQSPLTDGSSPIRPIVRKSSLNFASLPAREPLTSKKSIGNRVSQTSNLDQVSRTSYYGRHTGGKSIGNLRQDDEEENDGADEMEVDGTAPEPSRDEAARLHNKTSTQRLQDQINMLGKSQNTRPPSKSITANSLTTAFPVPPNQPPHQATQQPQSSPQKERPPPGAFPEDEDDSWIGPPNGNNGVTRGVFSPRPQMMKSHSTDVMEDNRGKDIIGGAQFSIPKRGEEVRQKSPLREPLVPERTNSTLGHIKSVSTSVIRSPKKAGDTPESKIISVSNPNPSTIMEESTTPPKSPSRSYKGSPLKAAKDKFSSILKTSRGLFASSAAVSADAKSNLSPSSSRMGLQQNTSLQSLFHSQPSYPDLALSQIQSSTSTKSGSPSKSPRKTRASTEREERRRYEEVKAAKEAKEAQKLDDQLEKARQKVKDEARAFAEKEAQQKERAMQREMLKESQVDLPRSTRSSPRKTKAQLEAEGIAAAAPVPVLEEPLRRDVEMSDTAQSMPPPALPRPKSQIGRPVAKRPLKPSKETQSKTKPPTIIRVDTGSQRGHQYHPSNVTLAATLQESLPPSQSASVPSSQNTLKHKASTSSIQSKASTSSFKSGATKALEAAARKKEQEEAVARKKRDAKLELERQRAVMKDEERRERERVAAAADAKKAASRQAMEKRRLEMEKAKETRPPPPAIRPQIGGDMTHDKALPPLPQPKAPRMNSMAPRSQEDFGRSVNVIHNSTKAPPKRPLQQDPDEHHSRPAIQRNGPSYQHNEGHSKRRKTSDVFDDDEMTENHPKMTAPPIRQSSIRPKEIATKSLFPSGYANAAPAINSLQKNTLINQANVHQTKPAHPMDMTQVSKAPIAFASSSGQTMAQSYKTPSRPMNAAGKSTAKSAKSSPRYQNGEHISLPEIQTDSEEEDDDEVEKFDRPKWTESPYMNAALVAQEGMDASTIFGPPRPLDMEAVFNKSKDKFPKFRARTSSANWDGEDRLTQDEIRKDVEARDKLRRQGFWTYEDMV